MPRAPAELLEILARHHGVAAAPRGAARPEVVRRARYDLGDADRLVGLDDDDVAARLEARLAEDPRDPLPALRAELRAFAAHDGTCVPAASLESARGAAVDACRVRTGRERVIAVGARTQGVSAPCEPFGSDALSDAARAIDHAAAGLACLLLEPRGDADALRELAARARAIGAAVVLDESRTAGRLAAGTASADLGLAADAVLLGPALAAGLPFGVVLARGPCPDLPPPDAATAEVARAVAARLRAAPVARELAEAGEVVRARFAARCRADDVLAELAGPAALSSLRFAGQENAEAPLIAHHFQLELRALGVHADADVAIPCGLDAPAVAAIASALEGAVSRIRTLLVEHNSYLSGGIAYVFPGGDERLRARGLARYRYPKLGPVDVEPVDGRAMRIAFASGPLGPITSSGFYVPTRLRGDFDISIHYAIEAWEPGPDSACLGLFVQNEPSTARYYAQVMSTSDRPGEISVAAGLAGALTGRAPIPDRAGDLRLVRRGDRVAALHRARAADDWAELGALAPCSRDDVIAGAKIWSKVRCGGLRVELSDLTIDAEIPAEQLPMLEARPDPRKT